MEFSLTDEQTMIRDSAESLLADLSDSAAVRAAMQSEVGHDPAVWRTVAEELAWPALAVPEAHGGLGLGPVELALLMEQMGRRLFCALSWPVPAWQPWRCAVSARTLHSSGG